MQDTKGDIDNYVYIEIEVHTDDLIIPAFTDGKMRVKSGGMVKVVRILTKDDIDTILGL